VVAVALPGSHLCRLQRGYRYPLRNRVLHHYGCRYLVRVCVDETEIGESMDRRAAAREPQPLCADHLHSPDARYREDGVVHRRVRPDAAAGHHSIRCLLLGATW